MGTSASNGGPKGSPPLLPDWFNDETPNPPDENPGDGNEENASPEGEPNQELPNPADQPPVVSTSKDWGKSKGALTRLANNTSGASYQKAGRKYVNSLGGARGATKAAAKGIKIGGRYVNFISSATSQGLNQTLTNLGLAQFIGHSSEEICIAIANALAPVGTTNDDAIAREALLTTIDSLYSKIQETGAGIEALESLSPEQIKETMIEYVSNFIFTKWVYELGNTIEKGNISEADAINLEAEIKELIYMETLEQYRDVSFEDIDLNDQNNQSIIEEIFQTAYSILES